MSRISIAVCCLAGLVLLPRAAVADEDSLTGALTQPPGQRHDVGGFQLHIHCEGKGTPVVVLDSGVGGFSLEWTAVQDALSRYTKVCAYDRAGYGWSEMGPLPRTISHVGRELHALLHAADLAPPYILVGHSFGGYSVQYFARTWKNEVAGMVLVEASHPEQNERLPRGKHEDRPSIGPGGRSTYINTQVRLHPNFPPEYESLALKLLQNRMTALTIREELLNYPLSARQILFAGELPRVPLVVLTRGQRVWPHTELGDALEATWMQLQDELAHLVPGTVHLIAEDSGHSIHMDEPGLVVTAIQTMLNRMDRDPAVAGR